MGCRREGGKEEGRKEGKKEGRKEERTEGVSRGLRTVFLRPPCRIKTYTFAENFDLFNRPLCAMT